jgi:hypothetical protein
MELIYELKKTYTLENDKNVEANISICYSGNDEENSIEFVYAEVNPKTNPHLSIDETRQINKQLECGLEEEIVIELKTIYQNADFNFIPGEYEFN